MFVDKAGYWVLQLNCSAIRSRKGSAVDAPALTSSVNGGTAGLQSYMSHTGLGGEGGAEVEDKWRNDCYDYFL